MVAASVARCARWYLISRALLGNLACCSQVRVRSPAPPSGCCMPLSLSLSLDPCFAFSFFRRVAASVFGQCLFRLGWSLSFFCAAPLLISSVFSFLCFARVDGRFGYLSAFSCRLQNGLTEGPRRRGYLRSLHENCARLGPPEAAVLSASTASTSELVRPWCCFSLRMSDPRSITFGQACTYHC